MRWSLAGLFACGLPVACADPCIDDGLGQAGEAECPQASAGQTQGATESNGDTDTVTDTLGTATMGSNTEGMTGSQTGTETVGETLDGTDTDTAGETETAGETDTDTDTDTAGETETAGGSLWCVDADEDGYGDPDMCQQSDEPIPGSVDNDDDCDDTNGNTYPGAAPNDDRRACMQDVDGDDWGDDEPPPGVDPGTDCLDDDATVRPGAADEEADLCTQDQDGDGWGDDEPPPGAEPGADCEDEDPNIFPGAAEQEPELCAEDQDDDGWGDSDPPPGVDPGTDCDDGNVYTFPGAAPNDDALACMQDEDDDEWGDDVPPPGVDAGTDCDDADPNAFPGAAPNETPPNLCTIDADGDGWGDANPGGGGGGGSGPQPGSDCYDTNIDINPDTLQLTAIVPYNGGPAAPRELETVDEATAALAPFVTLVTPLGTTPYANLVSATMNEDLEIFASDLYDAQLYSVDYAPTCGGGVGQVAPVGMPYGVGTLSGAEVPDIVCGLEFGSNGNLYGISHNLNQLLMFDTLTGQITSGVPLTQPALGGAVLDIFSCGTARDCTEERILVANGIDQSIYAVDELTGEVELLRDLDPYLGGATWTPVGLEYDPVSRLALLSTGGALYQIDLVNDVPPVLIGGFAEPVSNLQYLPLCSP